MKSTKGTKAKPREEECGKWLDTAELKEKKQKQLTRPIYKLLNPFASSGGYSVPVTLNFTQTKLNMPATRQSTISSFFSPKLRDTNPNATQDEMYTFTHTEGCSRAKRKHGVTLELSEETDITASRTPEVHQQNCDVDDEDVPATDSGVTQEKSFLHLMCGYEQDKEEPPKKKRALANYIDYDVLETQEYWNTEASIRSGILNNSQTIPETEMLFHDDSQRLDPLMVRKPFKEVFRNVLRSPNPKDLRGLRDKHVLRDQISTVEGSVLTSRCVNGNPRGPNAFSITNKDPMQSCCKSIASPIKLIGKENIQPASPNHNTPLSPFKRILISSPAKSRLKENYSVSLKKLGNEYSGSKMAGDSLAMLFTQDSEGFCVIAHRDQHPKSPLKDHTNVSIGRDCRNSPSAGSSEKEDSDLEAEMLFTQDSEGNMVIKH